MDLHTAIERLTEFSHSWNDDDVVDEGSGLTGEDLRLILQHATATEPIVRHLIEELKPSAD